MLGTRGAPLVALVMGSVLLGGCSESGMPGVMAVGRPMPAFAAPTLAGDSISLADLRGEVVVLNLWATWCPPCREEMPGLEALHRELGDRGLRVVGVSIDAPSAAGDIRSFLDDNDISFLILHDRGDQATRAFRPTGVPETYLIGRDGRLRQRWIGKIEPTAPVVREPVLEALRETEAD